MKSRFSVVLRGAVVGAGAYMMFGCDEAPTRLSNTVPAALIVESGDEQSAAVGTELPEALVVRVLNSEQQPIPNQIINFRVVKGGGSVFAGAALTNSEGIAQERWTLGTSVADSQVVEARAVDNSTGTALVFGRFVATAVAGAPASIEIVSGDAQSATASTPLPELLVVSLRDAYGNAVPNATVTWSIVLGEGSLSAASTTTDELGRGRVAWTLGSATGAQLSEARIASGAAVSFSATANSEPLTLTKIAGDNQVAAPGAAVAVAPSVRALDAGNNPKAGVTVTFAVTAGGGSTTGASAVTDQNGVATVGSWTLGSAGTNTLTATSPSGHMAMFTATASATGTAGIAVYDGNYQSAALGTAVSILPAARVTDAQGVPLAGVSVTFEVGVGGGSITGATVTSDQSGIARVGSWTLGNTTGTNTLVARLANGASATFTASAVRQSSGISVTIDQPSTSIIGDTIVVRATVTSTNQLASVVAQIGGVVRPLPAIQAGVWQDTVVIAGVPRDTVSLLVRATDVNGAVTDAIRVYTHDRKPKLNVTAPIDGSVARPSIRITATCDDDDPTGCQVTVRSNMGTGILAGPAASLDQDLDLQAYDGKGFALVIEARDSRNRTADAVWRNVAVESSTKLQEIAAGPCCARDLMSNRLLTDVFRDTLAIVRNLQNGVEDTIRYDGGMYRWTLTPTGAAFAASASVYIHRAGQPLVTRAANPFSFAANGPFVIYGSLWRFNTTTGTEDQIAASAAGTDNGVADNGDVAYSAGNNIFRYRGGATTAITNDGSSWWNSRPITDGTNIVFRHNSSSCCSESSPMYIVLYDGSTITTLAAHNAEVYPGTYGEPADYKVSGGWTAFTKPDANFTKQVWTRSPTGTMRQVSSFGSSSAIRALGSDGSVVFDNGTIFDSFSSRYYAGPTSAPVRVSSLLGDVRWRDNRFVTFIGRSAFAITP